MKPEDAPGSTDYKAIAARMGYGPLRERLKKQARLWHRETSQGVGLLRIERLFRTRRIVEAFLHISRLKDAGLRNMLDIRLVTNEVALPGLPAAFDGFRILQLSDLHCDIHPRLIGAVIEKLGGLAYDLAALTGDYRNNIADPPEASLVLMERLIAALHEPRVAVLGNHDFIEKVAYLEAKGLPVLLNESRAITRGNSRLHVAGIDDPHFFRTDDIVRARRDLPPDEPSILLSHSPEPYREAERLGFALMLCGHTHGGQFCLPGGHAIAGNARVPRRFLAGAWKFRRLSGYTSRGTGSSGVAARFHCPPEITLHVLRAGRPPTRR